MKIIFTKHALKRLTGFAEQGLVISRKRVAYAIKNPEHLDEASDAPKLIASIPIDSRRILRVVFKIQDDIITIITLYPAKKGRYYEVK